MLKPISYPSERYPARLRAIPPTSGYKDRHSHMGTSNNGGFLRVFDLLGNIGSGDGCAIQLIGGEIKIKSVRGKFDAREFKVGAEDISGQWSFGRELRIGIAPASVDEVSAFLAIIAMRAKTGDRDLDRYRGEYVLKVKRPKGESVLRGRLKHCSAG
jgi:hypothetical protein